MKYRLSPIFFLYIVSRQYMQGKVLSGGKGKTDFGSDIISQALTFKYQVNNNFSQKSSIRVPMKLGFTHYILHSWLPHAQLDYFQSWFSVFFYRRKIIWMSSTVRYRDCLPQYQIFTMKKIRKMIKLKKKKEYVGFQQYLP